MVHTPGPWFFDVNPDAKAPDLEIVDDACLGVIAVARPSADSPTEEDYANARVIAAAPELLAALQAFVDAHEREGGIEVRIANCLTLARAAIAKATSSGHNYPRPILTKKKRKPS